jgi:hypothetical protein
VSPTNHYTTRKRRPWDIALNMMGVATVYGSHPRNVTVLTAEYAASLSDDEIRACLKSGLLLDAYATEVLLRRGFGEQLGVSQRLADNHGTAQELITESGWGLEIGNVINVRWEGPAWQFKPSAGVGAHAISSILHLDETVSGHGVLVHENKLGGRVAIYPYDSVHQYSISGTTFTTTVRQQQVRAVLEWLGRGPLPLFVNEPSAYAVIAEQPGRTVVGVGNASFDPIESLRLELAKPPHPVKRITSLGADATWREIRCDMKESAGRLVIDTKQRLDFLDVGVFVLE